MKNIHVLPTPQQSKLFKYNGKLGFAKRFQYGSQSIINQHIYITSDEEIKERDWCIEFDLGGKIVDVFTCKGMLSPESIIKKIILTTDQDLIKDGVQSIDDEFLEWFVKNQSCEFIEVDKINLCTQTGLPCVMQCISASVCNENIFYKIIIPKEEAKTEVDEYYSSGLDMGQITKKEKGFKVENGKRTETFYEEPKKETIVNGKCVKCGNSEFNCRKPFCTDEFCNKYFYKKPKQETLEEAAERLYPENWESIMEGQHDSNSYERTAFIKGAKWQEQNSDKKYSEEEVLQLLKEREIYTNNAPKNDWFSINKWFEQFKKK